MSIAFVVMQIGDQQLDQLFETVIQPAIESVGLQAKRVDRHNEGGLLKSEIVQFLNDSEIIIADLTNERPNVYRSVSAPGLAERARNPPSCSAEIAVSFTSPDRVTPLE